MLPAPAAEEPPCTTSPTPPSPTTNGRPATPAPARSVTTNSAAPPAASARTAPTPRSANSPDPTACTRSSPHGSCPAAAETGPRVRLPHRTLPLRLEPLNLMARGGVVTILQDWQTDWHDSWAGGIPAGTAACSSSATNAVKALRVNLEWAASSHPAFGEFTQEITSLVRQCERQITGERKERPISVACPCGTILRITVSTPGKRCGGCGHPVRPGRSPRPAARRPGRVIVGLVVRTGRRETLNHNLTVHLHRSHDLLT
jgi:hypothetical protein